VRFFVFHPSFLSQIFLSLKKIHPMKRSSLILLISILSIFKASSQNFEWAQWFATNSDEDNFNAICTDDSGHVFLAIQFNNVMTIAGETFQTAPIEDVLIIKFDSLGNGLWANQISSPYWDQVNGMDCDAAGNLYLTGHYFGNLTVENTTMLGNVGGREFFLIKYSKDGQLLWTVNGANPWNEEGTDVMATPDGGVIVSGRGNNTAQYGNLTLQSPNPDWYMQEFVAKYDANGIGQWIHSCGPTNSANEFYSKSKIEMAPDNHFYIGYTGSGEFVFYGDTIRPNYYPEFSAGYDAVIEQWTLDGEPQWAWTGGSLGSDLFEDIAVDHLGRVYGSFNSLGQWTFAGDSILTPLGDWATTAIRLDTEGNEDAYWTMAGLKLCNTLALEADGQGNIWVGGMLRYDVTTSYGTVSSSGLEDRDGWFYRINAQTDSIDRMDGITGQGWQFVNGLAYSPYTGDMYIGGNTSGSIQTPAYFGWTDSIPQPYNIDGGSYPYLAKYRAQPCQSPLEVFSSDSLICLNQLVSLTTNHNLDYPLWSDSSTYSFLEVHEAGNYWVQGWDEKGCIQRDSIYIAEGQYITFTTLADHPSCFGASDGGFDLVFDTTQWITSFLWSNNLGANEDVSGITAGNYSVTVTNADGCTQTFPFILQQPNLLNVFISNGGNLPVAIANGGTPPYSFLWQPGNIEGDTLQAVSDGNYTVTVTDANGCTDAANINITGTIEWKSPKPFIYPNPFQHELNVNALDSADYLIVNTLGQQISEGSLNNNPIALDHLTVGQYILILKLKEQLWEYLITKID
jgi:hypothetical protein